MSRGIRKFNHPETEKSGPLYSGVVELIGTNQNILSDNESDKKPFIIRQVLNESQMSVFKSLYSDGKILVHLEVLNNTGTAYKLRPEIEYVKDLTEQEFKVLARLADGLSYLQIAKRHFVDLETIKTQVDSIYKKLRISNKTEAAIIYRDYISNLNHKD
jgi:DNA-binding NarL/FixJ family response regulator